MSEAQLIQRVTTELRAIKKLIVEEKKGSETWVKASDLKRLTIWKTSSQRQYAVKLGHVTRKKDENGIWYLWESVNPVHKEKQYS